MSIKNRITVVLWAILALSLAGCTVNLQAGKINTIHQKQEAKRTKERGRTITIWGHEHKATPIMDTIHKVHRN